ncbi:MAG: hypothetical protein H6Q58_78 [Firmicutes bacterium]|nr:hypothetical protein [Bacillota bacterium]
MDETMNAEQIWSELYNKELNSKKNILEYIEMAGVLKKQNASEKQLEETYNFIYGKIDAMKEIIKPNTAMYLKNRLKAQLGKYVAEKDPMPKDEFIEFFKQAYPEDTRRKDFTWVLMDINSISEEQAWTTLTYINRECLNNGLRLSNPQRKAIIKVIENTVKKNNVKYVNKVRSLKPLTEILNISIVKVGNNFRVRDNRLR